MSSHQMTSPFFSSILFPETQVDGVSAASNDDSPPPSPSHLFHGNLQVDGHDQHGHCDHCSQTCMDAHLFIIIAHVKVDVEFKGYDT